MRPSSPGRPTGHVTALVRYGFQKNNGSCMKCQPVRCVARKNGLASVASWNWLNVSETVMISVSLRATADTFAGAAVAAGAAVGAVAGSVVAAAAAVVGWGAGAAEVAAGAAVAGAAVLPTVGGATGTACDWQAAANAATAPDQVTRNVLR